MFPDSPGTNILSLCIWTPALSLPLSLYLYSLGGGGVERIGDHSKVYSWGVPSSLN